MPSPPAPRGKTYTGLADGEYTFKVRATDRAGNQQATPTAFTWTVDNSLADTTPPQTTIDIQAARPERQPDAAFTYASNEAGSSFECSLDGAAFAACPAERHHLLAASPTAPTRFQVRAIDPSANIDPDPGRLQLRGRRRGRTLAPRRRLHRHRRRHARPRSPQTILAGKPAAKTHDRTPTFRFRSDTAGAELPVRRRPRSVQALPLAVHDQAAEPGPAHLLGAAVIAAGSVDPTPASSASRWSGATEVMRARRRAASCAVVSAVAARVWAAAAPRRPST